MKIDGNTFDNSSKENDAALQWFIDNTYIVDDVLYWGESVGNTRKRSSVYLNKPAGTLSLRGYIQIRMGRDKFMAHRVIWAIRHGRWPKSGIDHINGNTTDNSADNLREVNQYVNSKNASKYPRKEDWIATGVARRGTGFIARAQVNKKLKYIGKFRCHTSAMFARILFDRMNGFTERHGQA